MGRVRVEGTTRAGVDSPRAWAMWAIALAAYTVAVMQRSSFGVASVEAAERFDSGASLVSLFVVVQMLTYAGMQIPAGILADRLGTRTVLATGAVLMCIGQVDLALSTNIGSAIIGRIFVGAGDALTFGPILRMLPAWFSPARVPLLNQSIGILGQSGQILSAIPFAAVLGAAGWTPAFASAAAVSAVIALVVAAILRNAPQPERAEQSGGEPALSVAEQLHRVVRDPASQLGFWLHWTCAFWSSVFALMWAYPYLMGGLGYSQSVASGLMSLFVVAGIPFALLASGLSSRAVLHRTSIAVSLSLLAMVPWLVVTLWPGIPPVWMLAILVIGIAAAGPGSSIGFDVTRTASPRSRAGAASGMVIVGGFAAGLLNIQVIGFVVDALGGYSERAFRWAMATQFVFWAIGLVGAFHARARARAINAARGVRHPHLVTVVGREVTNLLVAWRILRSPDAIGPAIGHLDVTTEDGRVVGIAAVLPGTGGQLTAIDVPPLETDAAFWASRVDDYLALVSSDDLEIGAVEVRCEDAATTRAVRGWIADELARRGATLAHEVTTRHHRR